MKILNNIILINVYYPDSGYGNILHYPPLGIAYISEYLNKKKIDHSVIDMGLGYTFEEIIEKIKHISPQYLGISINSILIDKTGLFICELRELFPDIKIVVGGPHVTTKGEKIFEEIPYIDYAIIGEGEESFHDLVSGLPTTEIKGLVYKGECGSVKSNVRRMTPDIDTIPFPKFSKFEMDKYLKKTIPIISSRGCPFKCIFCQQSNLLSKKWRGITAKYFIEILKYWKNKGYNEIQILDDNFIFDPKRLEDIAQRYEREHLKDIKLILVGGIRVHSANKKNLTLLKRIGVDFISIGVESFSDDVLKFINKGTNEAEIESAVKNVTAMGFKLRLFFIIGFPYQTVSSLRKTYKMILKYPVYQVRFFNLIPYENTILFNWLQENGNFLYTSNIYMNYFKKFQDIPVFEAKHTLSAETRKRELVIARNFSQLIDERSQYLFDELQKTEGE